MDPERRVIRYRGREAILSRREFQVLQVLLDNPHRYFKSRELVGLAWTDAILSADQVRNYVSRLRAILINLNVPCG